MSIEASSEQSYVCEGMGYNDVYLWGQNNIGAPYLESVLSTNSPPEEEKEDSNVDGSESTSGDSDSKESIENVESPIRFVIGLNGLRNFFLPLMWTINDFNSTIKWPHFDTLRERY